MRAVSQARAPSATEVIYVGGFVALALCMYYTCGVDRNNPNLPTIGLPIVLSVTAILFVLIATMTNPQQGGPIVVLGMQLLVFLLLTFGSYGFILIVNKYIGIGMNRQYIRIGAIAIGVGGVLLSGLQTLNQLNAIDVILVVVLEAGVVFYIFRRLGSYKS